MLCHAHVDHTYVDRVIIFDPPYSNVILLLKSIVRHSEIFTSCTYYWKSISGKVPIRGTPSVEILVRPILAKTKKSVVIIATL